MVQPVSLVSRVVGAYRAPATSYDLEKSFGLTERRLIAYAFGASLFLTLGRIMAESIRPELAVGAERTAWFAATILIGFSFGILALYGMAALIRIISRLFGGQGGWAETRLTLFWSGLAAGPLIALGHVAGAIIDGSNLGAFIGGAMWAVLFAPMLAAAHGFSAWKVAAFLVLLCAVLLSIPKLG